jgi:hypothetical protein
MASVDALFTVVCTIELSLAAFNVVVAIITIQGRWLSDEARSKLPLILRKVMPKIKAKVSTRSLILSLMALALTCLHQIFAALAMLNPYFSQDLEGCQSVARIMAFSITGAYFCMLRIMMLRFQASRGASDKFVMLEKGLNIAVWATILFPLMLAINPPGFMKGVIFPVDGNTFQSVCWIRIDDLVIVIVFTVLDLLLSTSLLLLFYLRMKNLAENDSASTSDSESQFLVAAKLNLKCSTVIICVTSSVAQLILFSGQFQSSFGVYFFISYIYISLGIFAVVIAVVCIFGNSFEWFVGPLTESNDRGKTAFLLSSRSQIE